MRRKMALFFAVTLMSCGKEGTNVPNVRAATAHRAEQFGPGATQQLFDGPGFVCGQAFAIILSPHERLTLRDPGVDFITYRVEGRSGNFLLYEGNAPEPHDDEIRTGMNFPSVIAIHDERANAQKAGSNIRDRLILGDARSRLCKTEPGR